MATGAECVAAVLGIIQFSVQLTDLCLKKYRAYQGAGKELQYLRSSVSIFSQTLHYFGLTMDELIKKRLGPAKDAGMRNLLVDIRAMVEGQTGEIQQSFHRLRALRHPRTSSLSRFKAKIMWIVVDARDMKVLLASLEPIKSTMNLLVNTSNCDLLLREIDQLHRDNKTISKDIVKKVKSYMGQIKMLKKEVTEKQRQYEALRTHGTSDANNSFYDLAQGQSIREIVEHTQFLATERISASRVIMREIGREETLSTSTETGSRNSTIPAAPAPLPPPPPHEPNMDGPGYPSVSHESEQDINNTTELFEITKDGAMEVESDVVEIVSEEPTISGPSGPKISATDLYLSHSTAVSNTSFPQEQPAGGSSDGPSPRYRMVIRKGKMISKRWRDSGDDADQSDSSSSGSE